MTAPTIASVALVDEFLWSREADMRSLKTIAYYRKELTLARRWALAQDLELWQATTRDLRAYFLLLQQTRNPGGVHSMFRVLRAWYNWMIDEELIVRSPLRGIKLSTEQKVIKPFAPEEVKRLLEAAGKSDNPLRDTLIVMILLETGMRRGELLGLHLSDFQDGLVKVLGKGRKERRIPVSPEVAKALRRYVSRERKETEGDILLIGRDGQAMTENAMKLFIYKLGRRAKVENVHAHRFRHTYATIMAETLGNAPMLQALLGHTRVDMSMHYVNQSQIAASVSHLSVLRLMQKGK